MNNPAAAHRVATMIATFKWIVLGLIALGAVIAFIVGVATADDGGIVVSFISLVVGAVYAAVTYVLFGWFEQTLRMLADIATNTGQAASTPAPPHGT